jgi:hypothetical protein
MNHCFATRLTEMKNKCYLDDEYWAGDASGLTFTLDSAYVSQKRIQTSSEKSLGVMVTGSTSTVT